MTVIPFFFNQCLDKGRLKRMILWSLTYQGEYKTIQLIENLKTIGFQYATYAGVSLGIDDLSIPPKKADEVAEAAAFVSDTAMAECMGNSTRIETLQSVIDSWQRTSEIVKQHVVDYFEATNILNPVYMMAFSGARGNVSQVRQLVGLRGLMADAQGNIIGFPIQTNFREGLTVTEYMISCYGARKGVVDTALRTADAGYLTRRLVDVAQHVVVQKGSCGTRRGISLEALEDYGEVVLPLQERLVGRVFASDFIHQGTVLGRRNQPISEAMAARLSQLIETAKQNNQAQSVHVRSPLTCELVEGVCQLCYGWSLAQSSLVTLGEAVGIIAGQSIGEPGTQLTMRTFHTGGVFTGGAEQTNEFRAPVSGVVTYLEPLQGEIVRTEYGRIGFLTKHPGTMLMTLGQDRRCQARLSVPTHTTLFVREGERVQENQLIGHLADSSSRRNERRRTRKILFSQFNGQVLYPNTSMTQTSFTGPSAIYATPLRSQYRVSSNLGTVWVLAGDYLGSTGNLLHMYRSSGHLLELGALTTRFGILGVHDGIICSASSSSAAAAIAQTKYRLPPHAVKSLSPNQDRSMRLQLDTAEKALYTPLFTGFLQTAWTGAHTGYTLIRTPLHDCFIINNKQLEGASLRAQLQTAKLGTNAPPVWASAGKKGEIAVTYLPSIFKADGGGFFWREQHSTDAPRNHGLIYWTPRMSYGRALLGHGVTVYLGWRTSSTPRLQPLPVEAPPMQFYYWALKQQALWGSKTLQNVTRVTSASTYGLVQYTGAAPSLLKRAAANCTVRSVPVPTTNPLIGRKNQQYDLTPFNATRPLNLDFFQFPFAEVNRAPATVDSVTIQPGWLYFPQPFIFNSGIAQSGVNYSSTFQSFVPALIDVQVAPVQKARQRVHQLIAKVYAGRASVSTPVVLTSSLNLLPSFRKIFSLRHPELVQFLVTSMASHLPKQAYQAAAQFYIFTHALSPWFYLVQPIHLAANIEGKPAPTCTENDSFVGWVYRALRLGLTTMPRPKTQIQSLCGINFNALVRATLVILNTKNIAYSFDRMATVRRRLALVQSFEGAQIQDKAWASVPPVWIKQSTTQLLPRPLEVRATRRLFLTPFRQLATKATYAVRIVSKVRPLTGTVPATLTFSRLPYSNASVSRIWSLGVVTLPSSATPQSTLQGPPNTIRLAHDPVVTRARKLGACGETFVTPTNEVVFLRSRDIKPLSLPSTMLQNLRVSVGQILRYGDELMPGVRTVVSGQIFAITPSQILVRHGQPVLFYKTGSLHVRHGQWVKMGHPLVTLTQQCLVTGDIVQGIPKVEQVFEASQGRDVEVNLPYILRHTFRSLKTSMVLPKATRTSLEIIQRQIIDRIQKIYLSQGVTISDKHFEVVVRQMTSKVRVLYPGDTGLFRGEIMPLVRVEGINAGTIDRKARYAPIISGISATALTSDSFLSAASFQETTRVLTRDAISRKTDFLRGLKERVILGDLIPAGTGLAQTILYRQTTARES